MTIRSSNSCWDHLPAIGSSPKFNLGPWISHLIISATFKKNGCHLDHSTKVNMIWVVGWRVNNNKNIHGKIGDFFVDILLIFQSFFPTRVNFSSILPIYRSSPIYCQYISDFYGYFLIFFVQWYFLPIYRFDLHRYTRYIDDI